MFATKKAKSIKSNSLMSKSRMKNLTLRTRFIIFTIIITLFLSLMSLFVSRYFYKQNYRQQIKQQINTDISNFYQNIERISLKALHSALICSELSIVKDAYKNYYQTKNIDEGSIILRNEFVKINNTIKKYTGNETKINFQIPPSTSFARSWSGVSDDNLGVNKKSLMQVTRKKQPVKGIEIDNEGIAIRGIAPIFSDDNSYLGSVELNFPVEEALKMSYINKDNDIALYIYEVNYRQIEKQYKNEKEHPKIGNFYLMGKTSNNYNEKLFDKYFLNEAFENKIITLEKDNYMITAIPITNFMKKNIGVVVFQNNIKSIQANFSQMMIWQVIAALIGIIAILFIFIFLIKLFFSKPLYLIKDRTQKLSEGLIADKINYQKNDEIGEIAFAINKLIESRIQMTTFANEIRAGNLDSTNFTFNEQNVLGYSLVEMQKSLKKAQEDEQKRKEEDQRRNWTTQGLAAFNDLIRQKNDNFEELANTILKELIKYLEANQGGLFIINDENQDDKHFQLIATYAYNRLRHKQKRIELNDGLIGSCAIEKESLYLTELPDEYIEITSGLGEATPKNLLLVPLKLENEVFGVLEIASFKIIEKYQIEFIEKVTENIAATLSISKINSRTSKLLKDSQEKSHQMEQQEKNMIENLEELERAQQKAEKRKRQIEIILGAIDNTVLRADFSPKGIILDANKKLLNTFGYDWVEIRRKTETIFVPKEEKVKYKKIWEKLEKGEYYEGIFKRITKQKREIWLLASYTPIFDENKKLQRIVYLANNITKQKRIEVEAQKQAQEMLEEELKHQIRIQQLEKTEKILRKAEKQYITEIEELKKQINNKTTDY